MRICLISQEYPPETAWGGVGTQTWVKARALARLGHEVHVLACSADERPDLRTELQDGVTVHRIHPPGYEFPIYGKPLWLLGYTWGVVTALHTLMERHAFDVLDFPEFGGEGFAYQIDRTRWNWVPVVVQLHGPMTMFLDLLGWPERGSRLHKFGMFMEEFSLQNADVIMACSGGVADVASRAYGLDRDAIDVVHCGVDTAIFSPAMAGSPLAERPTVLFVGKMVKNKGPLVVTEAVLALRHKYPDIHLQFIGTGTDIPVMIEARAREEAAEANIELLGFVELDRLPDYYRKAHVFCSPAEYEGFGQVYTEALACGCPVVASTSGGGSEAVNDGETGLLVPPNDVAATVRALDAILGDPALRQRMSAAGLRRVSDYFQMDRYVERVVAVYEKAIAMSKQRPDSFKDQTDWQTPRRPGATGGEPS